MASGIAHEIKNPLTSIKTFTEYLPKKIHDAEFTDKFIPLITSEVGRIDKLVHELLDFAKPSPAILSPTDISLVLNKTLDFLSNDFIKNKINIIKNYKAGNDCLINLDANQLQQALMNIILNAIDAMPLGGKLAVSTLIINNAQTFQLRIQDTGTGIDPKDIPYIFDPFFSKKTMVQGWDFQ